MKIFFRFVVTFSFFLFATFSVNAGPVKSALKLLQQGKLEKMEVRLQKMLHKDSVHAGARYAYSRLFIDTTYKHYSIDTAYIFIVQAIADYNIEPTKHLKSLNKDGIDSLILVRQRTRVDSLAYARATQIHTVIGYQYFLDTFLHAQQRVLATEARNELAFQAALKENTYESFMYFVQTYPDAHQVKDATQFYDILLFKSKTADKKESSYRNFLIEHPQTPYRAQAEEQIMLIATADNQISSYEKFLEDYPQSHWAGRINGLLFYNFDKQNRAKEFILKYSNSAQSDSLQKVINLRKGFLVPILENNQYGFMRQDGQILIKPQFNKINENWLCGDINNELLVIGHQNNKLIINREGTILFKGVFDQILIDDFGLVRTLKNGKWGAHHLLGFSVLENDFQSIIVLSTLVAAKKDQRWGLYSHQGVPLLKHEFDSIWAEGKMFVFNKDNKLAIALPKQIRAWADGEAFKSDWFWNEIEAADRGYYYAYAIDDKVALLNEWGQVVIPAANHDIQRLGNNWILKTKEVHTLLDADFKPTFIKNVEKLQSNKSFLAIKEDKKWGLNIPSLSWFPEYPFDSVALLGDYWALAFLKDSTRIYFPTGKTVSFSNLEKLKLRTPSSSSVSQEQQLSAFIEITNDKGFKKIYNHFGRLVLSTQQEEVSYLSPTVIALDKKGKKALYDSTGVLLLQPKYEAIGNYQSGTLALLGNRQFGLYHLESKKTIPMEYDRLIKPYNEKVFIAGKEGKLGLINLDNKKLSDFTFDEFVFWTDSIALIRQGEQWNWKNIYTLANIYGPVSEYKPIQWLPDHKSAMVYKDGSYGIFDSKEGEIIAATFNDLLNLGTTEEPLYFAEKHVTEADFFVVLYLDKGGKTLRKQVFTPEEYDLIYCD